MSQPFLGRAGGVLHLSGQITILTSGSKESPRNLHWQYHIYPRRFYKLKSSFPWTARSVRFGSPLESSYVYIFMCLYTCVYIYILAQKLPGGEIEGARPQTCCGSSCKPHLQTFKSIRRFPRFSKQPGVVVEWLLIP